MVKDANYTGLKAAASPIKVILCVHPAAEAAGVFAQIVKERRAGL